MPKVLLVIASRDFRDEEYEEPRAVFQAAGCVMAVASSTTNPVRGVLGTWVQPDRLLAGCRAEEFDAVVFLGGYGALEYGDNPTAHRLCREALERRRVLAALCVAPTILSRAGVLDQRRATCFPDQREAVEAGGAVYTGDAVTVDGPIVTADGPMHAKEFAHAVVAALKRAQGAPISGQR